MSPLLIAATLSAQGLIALSVTALVFLAMQLRRGTPIELLFLGGLVIVTLAGIISPADAVAGFSSRAVIMIGALFAASAGLRTTGALDWIGNRLLGRAETERGALLRLAAIVTPASAFVLNTPLVAMLAPVVVDWCRRRGISPSRLLIPLSYLTILGGVCTLIGTSTTLVINSLLAGRNATAAGQGADVLPMVGELRFFEMTWVGIPLAIIGALYVLAIAPRLLPNRTELIERFGERRREYLVEMRVQDRCPLIGKTVQEAGLRNLPGLFLVEIDRDGEVITPVAPEDTIQAGDLLVFTGVVTTIADLERIPGLLPAADETFEATPAVRTRRQLTEAVLSRTSPLIGRTVRESNFRRLYDAAVVAVHRNGERVTNKIGNIRLEPGDTLLLQTHGAFVEKHRNSREFYLVSVVGGGQARRHDRALLAGGLFIGLILWLTANSLLGPTLGGATKPQAPEAAAIESVPAEDGAVLSLRNVINPDLHAVAAVAIVLAMIAARCMTTAEARAAIDLQVLLVIGAALGLGLAVDRSGAASWLAELLVSAVSYAATADWLRPYLLLAIIYFTTQIFTELITNVAVATIMIPVSVEVASATGFNARPFIIAIVFAASLSFATPIGYQTNLMVLGPGGYRPSDYLKVGLPLAILISVSAILLIPLAFNF